jgi:hypothetical protein
MVSNEDPTDFQPRYRSADGKHRLNFGNSEEYYFHRGDPGEARSIQDEI